VRLRGNVIEGLSFSVPPGEPAADGEIKNGYRLNRQRVA